ncbi:hypothetical protein DKM44_14355 [Deinococcus irradiatisoli]|uniref:Uncharacterized protein n=1 Tax=Deinococcus irradiatisoli TaxID=2202254 RepID=A0A2Z3JGH5_9DEIO|nr:hypothetical protein [Deinococcus irradiatisoli]AWN24263.1 hypothetical protein DKM44_14355 [Deinococcus irradiatisoli]
MMALKDLPPASDDLLTLLFERPLPPTTPSTPPQNRPLNRWPGRSQQEGCSPLVERALEKFGVEGTRHWGAVWLGIQACSRGVPEALALEWAEVYADRVEGPGDFPAREAKLAVSWAYQHPGYWSAPSDQSGEPSDKQASGFGQAWRLVKARPRLKSSRPPLRGSR